MASNQPQGPRFSSANHRTGVYQHQALEVPGKRRVRRQGQEAGDRLDRAFFAELTYDGPGKVPYKFTTQVHIVPDVLPHSFDEFRKSIKK